MNKLCRYVNDNLHDINWRTDPYSLSWYLMGRRDKILNYTYELFMATVQYDKVKWARMDMHRTAYLEWIETLLPYELEGKFTEHELMELFSDE